MERRPRQLSPRRPIVLPPQRIPATYRGCGDRNKPSYLGAPPSKQRRTPARKENAPGGDLDAKEVSMQVSRRGRNEEIVIKIA